MNSVESIPWDWLAYLFAVIFFVDKALAAIRRVLLAPGELRNNILLRAEKIHAEQQREVAEGLLASRADEIISLVERVGAVERMLAEALAQLRPNGGASLHDRIVKLDKDFRDSIEDSQRWRREVMRQLESGTSS